MDAKELELIEARAEASCKRCKAERKLDETDSYWIEVCCKRDEAHRKLVEAHREWSEADREWVKVSRELRKYHKSKAQQDGKVGE